MTQDGEVAVSLVWRLPVSGRWLQLGMGRPDEPMATGPACSCQSGRWLAAREGRASPWLP